MKLTTGILAVVIMTGAAWAQNPDAIDNTRSVTKSLQQIQTNKTNEALAVAAGAPNQGQTAAPAAGPATAAKPAAVKPVAVKPAATQPASKPKAAATNAPTAAGKPHDIFEPKKVKAGVAGKTAAPKSAAKTVIAVTSAPPVAATATATGKPAETKAETTPAPAPKPEEKKWAMTGKRDPFFSPVVQQPNGSGCSSGKKCLEIGQINLRGVVKAESGFIAVVTNSLNKAYFLHENDPVFNGYVMRITQDSVVFSETVQDKLGKPLQHEVVKRITAPAV
jgi:Tfp pilus assembly protein PilP